MKHGIKERLRKTAYSVFSIISRCLPKQDRIFVYGGDFLLDNSEAMLRYLARNYDWEIVCVVNKRIQNQEYYKNVIFKNNSYWNAFFACATCKVMLESSLHTIKMKPTKGQLFIQMWHGSPLKHLPMDELINNGIYYSCFFYTSELFKNEMKSCFSADDEKMHLSGLPRNDYLFSNVKLPEIFNNRGKSVMWLPTFRHGIGMSDSSIDIPILKSDNIQELADFLKKKNIKIFIKAHPLQANKFDDLLQGVQVDSLQLITDDELRDNGITLYEMLGSMDALITDYSSVYFDYLLLNRPIGFTIEDMEEYEGNRGFALSNPKEFMPGPQIRTLIELQSFLTALVDGVDDYYYSRKRVNDLANYYQDNNNCRRCAELIKKVM